SGHVHPDVHVKIKPALPLLPEREAWVLNLLEINAKSQPYGTLRSDIHGRSAKQPVNEVLVYIEFGDRIDETAFRSISVAVSSQLFEIFGFLLISPPLHIFVESHVGWITVILVADLFGDDVITGFGVVFYFLLNDTRIVEVEGIVRAVI